MTVEPVSESMRMAEFASTLTLEAAPVAVVAKLRTNLLHNLGMVRAGARIGTSGPGLAVSGAGDDGPMSATLLHDGSRAHRDRAIICNAAMLHASARDDTYLPGITHIAVTSLPTLLALGETLKSSGADLMTSLLAAYEIGAAVSSEVGPIASGRGFRPSSSLGAIASSVGASRMLGLDLSKTASAIGLAASFGGGTGQTWIAGTDEWQYQVGVAGRNGLLAAELSAEGARAAVDSLEGDSGLYVALTGSAFPRTSPIELGHDWRILEVTYKPYPICAINQMPVTVLAEMMKHFRIKPSQIGSIRLWLSPSEAAYPGTDTHGPFSGPGGSLMSAPFCLAVAALHGTVTWELVEAVDDADIGKLTRQVEVVPEKTLAPGHCRIVIGTGTGTYDSADMEPPSGFNWDYDQVCRRLENLGDERGLSNRGLQKLTQCIDELESRSVSDLVNAVLDR